MAGGLEHLELLCNLEKLQANFLTSTSIPNHNPTSHVQASKMEILTHNEGFRFINGKLRYHCVKGIVRRDNVLYAVEWDDRCASSQESRPRIAAR